MFGALILSGASSAARVSFLSGPGLYVRAIAEPAGSSSPPQAGIPSTSMIVLGMMHATSFLTIRGFEAAAEVQRGDPAARIVATAAETRADLTVMATHGKIGGSAFWEGSVAPKVLKDTFVPVLLVPVAASRA